jgi:hypothetical protein
VLLYDEDGEPRVVQPGMKGRDELVEIAERMVSLAEKP